MTKPIIRNAKKLVEADFIVMDEFNEVFEADELQGSTTESTPDTSTGSDDEAD